MFTKEQQDLFDAGIAVCAVCGKRLPFTDFSEVEAAGWWPEVEDGEDGEPEMTGGSICPACADAVEG